MFFRSVRRAGLGVMVATVMRGFASAQQQSKIVPLDLQDGFASSGVELQVSYTNKAVNGFADGTTFSKDEVSQEPTFALGDSSAISTSSLYTIVMLDTTSDAARTLHYARANFQYNFDIVNIDTQDAPLLEYKAPGAFAGENNGPGERQYSFLMYMNPERQRITELKLPQEGEPFDVSQFQDDNGLEDACAGVGMVVKMGGGGGGESSSADSQTGSASTVAAATTPSSSTRATSGAAERASSSTGGLSATATGTGTGGEREASSAASARTTDVAPASSALESAAPGPSTVFLTSVQPVVSSQTATGAPAAQTASGAAALWSGTCRAMVVAAFAGFLTG